MSDQPVSNVETPEPANLRFLRRLVTTLTATMILGLLAIFVVLVMRLNAPSATGFPDTLALPAGETVQAVTKADGYLLVVTTSGKIYVMSPDGGSVRKELTLD